MEAPLRSWIDANKARVSVSESINPIVCTNSSTNVQPSNSDRSIFAQSAIAAEQELITLQDGAYLNGSAWLSSLEASQDPSTTASDEDVQKLCDELQGLQLSPTVQLVMALLYECGLKEKSRFVGYIEQLPKRIPLPMTWSEKARRALKHTAASPSIDDELVANMFKSFGAPLAKKFSSFWPTEGLTLERFQWAYAVVSSRAFTISDAKEPTLLPVIDMANHDHTNPAAKIVKSDKGAFQLVALRDIAKGEAVTISYGDLSNAELLCRYGFVLPEAVSTDCILVASSELLATYTAFLNDDADNDNGTHTNSDSEADKQEQGQEEEPATKKRKLFTEKSKKNNKEPSGEDSSLYFLLHGDQVKEFGLADALLSFVFAKSLPAEVLYDVLAVLLRKRDKVYSDALKMQSQAPAVAADDDDEVKTLVHLLNKHERDVCRRILLGIISLEEDSGDDDEDDEDESAESYEDGDDDDDDEE